MCYLFISIILLNLIACSPPSNKIWIAPNQTAVHEPSQIEINLEISSIFSHLSAFGVTNTLIDKVQGGGLGLLPQATFINKNGSKRTELLYVNKVFDFSGHQITVLKLERSN